MANAGRPTTTRRNPNTAKNSRGVYVEGSAARRLQEVPDKKRRQTQTEPVRKRTQEVPAPKKRQTQTEPVRKSVRTSGTEKSRQSAKASAASAQVSRKTQRNREKAMNMSRGFVVFLAVVSVAVLFACIQYLQLKSELTSQMKTVAALESELTELREDNNAYESQVTSNVDLNEIKKIAIGRLGMKYPSDDQKMTYESSTSSYVRQYQDIPESK